MTNRLLVATRKGLFEFERAGAGWRIAEFSFLGEPVSMVLSDRRDGATYAALALGHFGVKLHRRERAGPWREVTAPAFPTAAGDAKATSVALLWSLESAGPDRAGALWAGTIPGGLFRSSDRGESWSLIEPLWNRPERQQWVGGGYDQPGIHSIVVDPRDSRRLLVGVSTGGVWLSDDAGASWRLHGHGMHAEYLPPDRADDPLMQDVHRIEQCPAAPDTLWVQHHNGVFRSTDRATSWATITAIRPAKFGFAVAAHPRDPMTAWFAPAVKDECRVPVDGAVVVARSRDGGASFDVLREGLPQRDAFDLVYRHGLVVDDTGSCLAMGSTTGHLWISENAGDRWTLVAGNLPPIACLRFA
ncbi:MAG: exo-alpha-sialidase [Alphaproteobacteria bacterium]|nr:exo-alpha-sialidase [Alphaproteobacteria bacterium]